MRAIKTTLFACLLSLSDIVQALPAAGSTVTITASIVSTTPLSTKTVQASNLATTVNTIDVLSFMTSPSPTALRATSSGTASTTNVNESPIPMSSTSAVSQPTNSNKISHQTLVIILSAVLGFLGVILLAGAVFLIYRFSKGQAPFRHRGASPINDDEIESWRRSGREKLPLTPPDHGPAIREVTSLPMRSPAWTWAASPSSIRTVSANLSEPHSVVAQAPNARAGLTDEALPGADPFITPPKRQSSRLSKAPPGHARTKSRRSSISAKSMRSGRERSSSDLKAKEMQSVWYDQDDEIMSSHLRTDNGRSSLGTPDFFDGIPSGGLSPRPKSRTRPWEIQIPSEDIGRAIA
ncbi:hypothetical protein EG329_009337 [Mollisiaceae sp. DMI_Dod_QoI]|nr:hypothetical protein EG329_009337 [Helotiales sp. DMI_Dod_QoI]